ncbi:hypothetical protein Tco_0952639 [Tanacetum coccineum]|uniref:Uncharacterized protein n=1 Tax=Tanacetum coccineum TaxID=301880 RepID=A0ABQ5DYH3_9ASTR
MLPLHHDLGDGERDSTRHLPCLLPIRRRISVFGLYSSNSRAGHYPCDWRGSMLEGLDIMVKGGIIVRHSPPGDQACDFASPRRTRTWLMMCLAPIAPCQKSKLLLPSFGISVAGNIQSEQTRERAHMETVLWLLQQHLQISKHLLLLFRTTVSVDYTSVPLKGVGFAIPSIVLSQFLVF